MAVSYNAYPKLSRIQCESAAVAVVDYLWDTARFKANKAQISFRLISIRCDRNVILVLFDREAT